MTPSIPRAPEARTAPLPSAPAWSTCPECWGQRRIIEFRPAPNGEGPVPSVTACSRCLGIGEVLR
jgi:hypothetical protein